MPATKIELAATLDAEDVAKEILENDDARAVLIAKINGLLSYDVVDLLTQLGNAQEREETIAAWGYTLAEEE